MNSHIVRISAANICIRCLVVESCVWRCSLSCGILFECVVIEHCSSLRVEVIIINGPSVENGSK